MDEVRAVYKMDDCWRVGLQCILVGDFYVLRSTLRGSYLSASVFLSRHLFVSLIPPLTHTTCRIYDLHMVSVYSPCPLT